MKQKVAIILILALAIGARFYRINQVPMGLTWDEASIAYNAWSVSEWYRDENAVFMPLAFRSFGDYKPPFLVYWLAGQYVWFGLVPEFLRFNAAIFGLGSVILLALIAKTMNKSKLFVVLVMLLASITPWGIHFSRIGFEQIFAWFFVNLGMYQMLVWKGKPKHLISAAIALSISLYTFHTARVFVPVVLVWFGWWRYYLMRKYWRQSLCAVGLLALLSLPLIYAAVTQGALTRASSLVFFGPQGLQTPWAILIEIGRNLLSQLSPQFWIGGFDAVSIRHSVPGWGVLLKVEYGLWLLGLIKILKDRKNLWLLWWLGIGLLPAILSHQAPHALRSLFALTPTVLIAAIGWKWIFTRSRNVAVGIGLMILVEFGLYLHAYFGDYAVKTATQFQYGYKELVTTLKEIDVDIDKVVVTDAYGATYIYFLLYNQILPQDFLWGGLNHYVFRPISWPETMPNALFVGSPAEIPPTDPRVIRVISVPETGEPVWVIAKT